MTKHDCPDCHCEERPECVGGHCLHTRPSAYIGVEQQYCCRCPYWTAVSVSSEANSISYPYPGCKVEIQVT